MDHDGHEITIVDTPGYADFAGEVVEGFEAATRRSLTMDASGGVEAGTERAVALGREHGTAALFVITRCERENADPTAALDALARHVRQQDRAAPPGHRQGRQLPGLRRSRPSQGLRLARSGKRTETEIPAELADEVARRRDQLLEAAAEADDDVLTKYLEGEEITDAELEGCLHRGVRDSILAPVMVTAAHHDIGIDGLLDAIVALLPLPRRGEADQGDRRRGQGGRGRARRPTARCWRACSRRPPTRSSAG